MLYIMHGGANGTWRQLLVAKLAETSAAAKSARRDHCRSAACRRAARSCRSGSTALGENAVSRRCRHFWTITIPPTPGMTTPAGTVRPAPVRSRQRRRPDRTDRRSRIPDAAIGGGCRPGGPSGSDLVKSARRSSPYGCADFTTSSPPARKNRNDQHRQTVPSPRNMPTGYSYRRPAEPKQDIQPKRAAAKVEQWPNRNRRPGTRPAPNGKVDDKAKGHADAKPSAKEPPQQSRPE